MSTPRIVARLDIKNNSVIKGIHLEGIRRVGDPEELAVRYYDQGVDEIFYQDAVASLYGRNSLVEVITAVAREIFVPFCVAGGIRKLEDADELFRSGADKVAVNTEFVRRPEFATQIAKKYGSQAVVGQIDVVRRDSKFRIATESGREFHPHTAVDWSKTLEDAGVGELLVTSVDQEGTGNGFDLDLLKEITENVDIPVIASGGFSKSCHAVDAISEGGVQAVAVARALHFQETTVSEIKDSLSQAGISVRPT